MTVTCKTCDERRHDECNGIAVYMDQDGPQNLTCQCQCRSGVLAEQRQRENVAKVNRLLRETGLDRTHELVGKRLKKYGGDGA